MDKVWRPSRAPSTPKAGIYSYRRSQPLSSVPLRVDPGRKSSLLIPTHPSAPYKEYKKLKNEDVSSRFTNDTVVSSSTWHQKRGAGVKFVTVSDSDLQKQLDIHVTMIINYYYKNRHCFHLFILLNCLPPTTTPIQVSLHYCSYLS